MLLDLLDIHSLYLAQEGSAAAVDVIENALELTENTIESWNETWIEVVSTESQLWVDIVDVSKGILAFAFIYMFIRYGNEVMKSKYLGTIAELFTMPLVVLLFLGGDGLLLSNTILVFRGIGYDLTTALLSKQLFGYTLQSAVEQFGINNLGVQRIKQVYSECEGMTGDPFLECWDSKAPEVQAIYDRLQGINGELDLGPLQAFGEALINRTGISVIRDVGTAVTSGSINGALATILQDRLIPIIQSILYAVQWAFVNLIEASLLISAIIAPIALALSVLPVAGRPILAWGSGFLGLLLLQLSYNLLVGLVAVVLANIDGGAIETSQNLGFLVFLSIFAPAITTALASYSATSLFTAISNRANSFAAVIAGGISTATKFATPGK